MSLHWLGFDTIIMQEVTNEVKDTWALCIISYQYVLIYNYLKIKS